MSTVSDELRAALADVARSQPGDHPQPEELGRYHEGGLAADREEQIQDHLLACRPCRELVLDLAGFLAPDDPADEFAATSGWRDFQRRMPASDAGPQRRHGPRLAWTVAAASLVAVVGLGGWNLHLTSTLAGIEQHETGFPVVYLGGEERSGATATAAGGGSILLEIMPRRSLAGDRFTVELRDYASQELIWTADPQPKVDDTLWLRLSRVPPGAYRVRVRAVGGAEEDFEEWPLTVAGK